MISTNFTTLTNPTITDVVGAFNTSLNNLFIFVLLLAFMLVLALSVYSVNQNLLDAFALSLYVSTVAGFMLTITKTSNGDPLLEFKQFTIFIILLAIVFIAKKVTD